MSIRRAEGPRLPPPAMSRTEAPERLPLTERSERARSTAESIDRNLSDRDSFVDERELNPFGNPLNGDGAYNPAIRGIESRTARQTSESTSLIRRADPARTQDVFVEERRQPERPAINLSLGTERASQDPTRTGASSTPVQGAALDPRSVAIAQRMVRAGGTAQDEDVAIVRDELARLPYQVLELAERGGLTVVAARESVTDHATQLKGQAPRGWPPGATWDAVPGAYLGGPNREVVVATNSSPTGGREVARTGEGHGAYSLLIHEFAHGLDRESALGERFTSRSQEFADAYEADRASLQRHGETYLLQSGEAGREEAFAEAYARFAAGDPSLRETAPNLHAYFAQMHRSLGVQ